MVTTNNPAFQYYYAALPAPALIDSRLKDRDRRLLAAFYLIAGRGNIIYNKTRKELGQIAGNMAECVVSVISARLVRLGWLKKSGNGGHGKAATYELIIPESFAHMQRPVKPHPVDQNRCGFATDPSTKPQLPQRHSSSTDDSPSPVKQANAIPSSTNKAPINPPALVEQHPIHAPLIYPNGLDVTFANALLSQLPSSQQQTALDEWAGQVSAYRERYIPIISPGGLFRAVVKSLASGQMAQHASFFKQCRERAQTIAKAIEDASALPASLQTLMVSSPIHDTSKARFAPGELKAKLLGAMKKPRQQTSGEMTETTPSMQEHTPQNHEQTDRVDTKKSVVFPQTTRYAMARIDQKNPLHSVTAHRKNKKPIKNNKPTTTSHEEKIAAKQSAQRGSGDNQSYCSNNKSPLPDQRYGIVTLSPMPMLVSEGVGQLADYQSPQWPNPPKSISHGGFVKNPAEQRSGRGQLPNGSSPPHRLFPTSSTAPDALRLPNQTHCLSLFHPVKPNQQTETRLGYGQHEVMITDQPNRIH